MEAAVGFVRLLLPLSNLVEWMRPRSEEDNSTTHLPGAPPPVLAPRSKDVAIQTARLPRLSQPPTASSDCGFRTAVTAAFRLIDKDRNGMLSKEEMVAGLTQYPLTRSLVRLREDASLEAIEEVCDGMSFRVDGSITEEEWIDHFCGGMLVGEEPSHSPALFDPLSFDWEGVGFLLDLDGTMTLPGALIPGAADFYRFLVEQNIPHILLSNTGAKGAEATSVKLAHAPYQLSHTPIPVNRILTAADVQADYMVQHLPSGSHLLVVSGNGSFWRSMVERRDPDKYASWTVKTSLTEEEAKEWAVRAEEWAGGCPTRPRVAVVFFIDGQVIGSCRDMSMGWSYELITTCAFLLSHGAELLYTADDPYNTSSDQRFSGHSFPLPGPGMFSSMLRPVVPRGQRDKRLLCCGKGGNLGAKYMMERAIGMLCDQGHNGDRNKIIIVGDRFATDIRAGCHVGIKTCLVETGCDRVADSAWYPTDVATYHAPSVGHLIPPPKSS